MSDEHVNPGDLITAELWNRVVDRVQQVQDRLDKLVSEGGLGQIMITSTYPADDIRVGDTLTIFGLNFGLATDKIEVLADDQPITSSVNFTKSNDQKLVIDTVPGLGLAPGGVGRNFVLTVRNQKTSDSVTRRFLPPPVALQGNVFVDYRQLSTILPTANTTLYLPYEVFADTNTAAQFSLVSRVIGQSWASQVVTSVSDDTPISSLTVASGQTLGCAVAVNIPSGATQAFAVCLHAVAGSVQGTSGQQILQVGTSTPTLCPNLRLRLFQATAGAGMNASFNWETSTISVAADNASSVTLSFSAYFTSAGEYACTTSFLTSAFAPSTSLGWVASASKFFYSPTAANEIVTFTYGVYPLNSSSANAGYLLVTITEVSTGRTQMCCFALQRTA